MNGQRFQALDGWRGISILLVLAAHMLPLGPKPLELNKSVGLLGMALFFTLSGFLITHFLLHRTSVVDFLIRRFFRIIPLAWVYMTLALALQQSAPETWLAHLLFYANYPPKPLTLPTDHLWSLCVEMQFYVGIALLVALLRRRGLMLLPLLCLAFTAGRIVNDIHYSVITHFRVDEILAGCILALTYDDRLGALPKRWIGKINPLPIALLLAAACHPEGGALNYFRPYFAATLVGITLFNPQSLLVRLLDRRTLIYIASVSYAVYVIHPLLIHSSWLGSGDLVEKYSKRPLLLVSVFILSHVSTYYFEQHWIEFGKRLSGRLRLQPAKGAGLSEHRESPGR